MDKRILHRYLNGWQEVAKLEARELQNTPLRVKFKQILSIFKLGVGLGMLKKERADKQISVVRSRWCLLKTGY